VIQLCDNKEVHYAFLERHTEDILGAYSCFDRIIIQGALPDIAHADAITQWFFWHDKLTHRTFFRYDTGRCVHYCNGHNWLARRMTRAGISFTQVNYYVEADLQYYSGTSCEQAKAVLPLGVTQPWNITEKE
jgi:hypothetical protein